MSFTAPTDGSSSQSDLAAAQTALQEGRFPEAIEIARRIVAEDRGNFDAWQILGVAAAQAGQPAESAEAFTQCVRQRPNIPQPHFNLAQALLAQGKRDKAREELEMCLTLDPNYTKAGQALRQLGDAPAAPGIEVPGIASSGPSFGGPPPLGASSGGLLNAPSTGYTAPAAGYVPPAMGQPQIGQAPPAFTPGAPAFTPGAQAPGMAGAGMAGGLGGGQMPPPMPTMVSAYNPMQQPVGPAPLQGSTRGWAISAIVLGSICGLLSLIGLPASILNLIIAICFVAGGVGVLQQQNWGRVTMVVSTISAIVLSSLGCIVLVVAAPVAVKAYSAAMSHAMAQRPQTPGMPDPAVMAQGFGGAVLIGVIIALIIVLGYNIPLLLHMKSETVKESMLG